MKKKVRFWIHYSTSVCIEAETEEDAIRQFYVGDESNKIDYADFQIDSVEKEEV